MSGAASGRWPGDPHGPLEPAEARRGRTEFAPGMQQNEKTQKTQKERRAAA